MNFTDIIYQYFIEKGYNPHIQCEYSQADNNKSVQFGLHFDKGIVHIYLKDGEVWIHGSLFLFDLDEVIGLVDRWGQEYKASSDPPKTIPSSPSWVDQYRFNTLKKRSADLRVMRDRNTSKKVKERAADRIRSRGDIYPRSMGFKKICNLYDPDLLDKVECIIPQYFKDINE